LNPENSVRVLEAITPSRIGGAEVYVTELCNRLPNCGIETLLFCPSGRTFVDYAKKSNLHPITWNTYGKLDPLTVIRLIRLIKSSNCQAVHTHLSTASLLGAFAAKLAKVPSVAHVHGMNSAFSFKFADRIIAVSEAVKANLAAQGLEKNVHVVYNGVDMERFAPMDVGDARSRTGLEQAGPVFGVFGRLSVEKGQLLAIEAFAKAFPDRQDAVLLVVGDGRDEQVLRNRASELGVSDNVRFIAFTREIGDLIASCDAVLVPSLKEGFGLTAVNSMAMSRPVIASRVGGLPEVVVDGETGLLTEPGNADSLADAMREIASDAELAQQIGQAGRLRAVEKFEINKQIAQVAAILIEKENR
jgi:glycosyltransferase involved in cell wall biosynthesis